MTGQADTDLDSALATSPFDAVHPLFPLWMQPRGKSKSISHRCYLREVAFDWELTNETIYLPLCGFQGALNSTSRFLPPLQNAPTKGPMWGYPRGRFWDLGTVLEPFCGKLLPKVDKPVKN